MLIDFFYHLRAHKLPVTVQEYLSLLEAMRHPLMTPTLDDFYLLARAARSSKTKRFTTVMTKRSVLIIEA